MKLTVKALGVYIRSRSDTAAAATTVIITSYQTLRDRSLQQANSPEGRPRQANSNEGRPPRASIPEGGRQGPNSQGQRPAAANQPPYTHAPASWTDNFGLNRHAATIGGAVKHHGLQAAEQVQIDRNIPGLARICEMRPQRVPQWSPAREQGVSRHGMVSSLVQYRMSLVITDHISKAFTAPKRSSTAFSHT